MENTNTQNLLAALNAERTARQAAEKKLAAAREGWEIDFLRPPEREQFDKLFEKIEKQEAEIADAKEKILAQVESEKRAAVELLLQSFRGGCEKIGVMLSKRAKLVEEAKRERNLAVERVKNPAAGIRRPPPPPAQGGGFRPEGARPF